jgi:hypothetical protein
MSKDRRNTVFIPGQDPLDIIEETPEVNMSYARHYHIRCDVDMPLVAGESSGYGYVMNTDIEVQFESGLSLYEWNGQEIFGTDGGVRTSRSEYTSLDVAGEFITEED